MLKELNKLFGRDVRGNNMNLEALRSKWREVPAGGEKRILTSDLIMMTDDDLMNVWEQACKTAMDPADFDVRGWYHVLYADLMKQSKIMDVGSGLGMDGIKFASLGGEVTFVDIVESNLEVIKRVCDLKGIANVEFCYLKELEALDSLAYEYDVIWCQGSMINAPLEMMQKECSAISRHLRKGGRWIELAYPETRWRREGSPPLEKWGDSTDGGAPWIEWYDLDKIMKRLSPALFEVVLYFEFHNNDFNWFDLMKVSD